jgi:uncharacterized protein (TIGR02246 family)
MRTTCALLLFLLALPLAADDAADLRALLDTFLAGAGRNDAAVHDRFWADDLIYTGSSGRRIGKADIMKDVRSGPPPKPGDPSTVFSAEDVRIQQYGDTAVVAFRLVGTTSGEGRTTVSKYLNSGTFVKRDGKWQVVNWQATKMPRPEEESKRDVVAAAAELRKALASGDAKKIVSLADESFAWNKKPASTVVNLYGETAIVRGPSETLVFVNRGGVWKAVAVK